MIFTMLTVLVIRVYLEVSLICSTRVWNYAKLISGVIRNGMPIVDILNLVQGLELDSESINTWKNGVEEHLNVIFPMAPAMRPAKSVAIVPVETWSIRVVWYVSNAAIPSAVSERTFIEIR